MHGNVALMITLIVALGIGAQLLSWHLRIPSIIMLLGLGLVVGPVTGWLHVDQLIPAKLLNPGISIAVAVILFEGGLQLKYRDIHHVKGVVLMLISLGAMVCWGLATLGAVWILGLPMGLSVLLGAILIVTGPTVIMPLMQHIRPTPPISSILKWEGIVTDPIGAIVAVLVFGVLIAKSTQVVVQTTALGLVYTLLFGSLFGGLAAFLLVVLIKRHWLPDFLESVVSLALVLLVFSLTNLFQHEAGLFAVTLMGIILANQKQAHLDILEFKETLGMLLISVLFIVLAAQVKLSQLLELDAGAFLFVLFLFVVVRPASVFISTIGSSLTWKQRVFLSWMAPRGIVAAAVVSLFALKLQHAGFPGAERLVPIVFLVIILTVVVYGLTAPVLAVRLGLGDADPQGLLFVGALPWCRELALLLQQDGFRVKLIDNNYRNVTEARMKGLEAHFGNILSDHAIEQVDLGGIGRLLAVTPNDSVNSLAVVHFGQLFPKKELYQLYSTPSALAEARAHSTALRGRSLFLDEMDYQSLALCHERGSEFKRTLLTEEFTYESFQAHYDNLAIPLFVSSGKDKILPVTTDVPFEYKPGMVLFSLIPTCATPFSDACEADDSAS
jgi:NhaP-type Na+/H+ or K+/H+ antiporter